MQCFDVGLLATDVLEPCFLYSFRQYGHHCGGVIRGNDFACRTCDSSGEQAGAGVIPPQDSGSREWNFLVT